jgi:hypothetical protein
MGMKVVLLQLFWLSFAIIGAAEFLTLSRVKRLKNDGFLKFLSRTHLLSATFIALASGMATFVLVVAPACFLELPIIFVQVFYFVLLAISIGLLTANRAAWLPRLRNINLSKRNVLFIAIIGGILALEFWTAIRTGGQLDGDAQFELAQINLFAQKHLTLADAVFGDQGVPMTVYSTSILHALQALAATILNASAAWVWFYSHAFFRLIVWVAFFAVGWELLDKKVRDSWGYVILVLLPFLMGSNFMHPELHTRIVLAWTALLLVGIKLWLDKKSVALIAVAAILIATTHPLNAVMAAVFLTLLSIVLMGLRLIKKEQLRAMVPIIFLLMLPIMLYFYYPHEITSAGFHDGPSSGPSLYLKHYGPFTTHILQLPYKLSIIVLYLVLAAYLYGASRLSNPKVRMLIWGLVVACGLLVFDLKLISVVGYGYLIAKASDKKIRAFLVLVVVYLGLIIYNPLIWAIARNRLPLWVISRFHDFNVLIYIAPIIGLLCVMVLPPLQAGYKRLASLLTIGTVVLYIGYIPLVYPFDVTNAFKPNNPHVNKLRLETLETLKSFDAELRGQVIFSDDPELMVMIPVAVVAQVFSIDNEANANPAVKIEQRKQCTAELIRNLKAADLKAASITIVITTDASINRDFEMLSATSPYLSLIKDQGGFRLYAVRRSVGEVSEEGSICRISSS